MFCKGLWAKRLGFKPFFFVKGEMTLPCSLMHYRGIFLEGRGGVRYCNFHSVPKKAKTDALDAVNYETGRWDQSNNTCVSVA
jgi:hypothetical protein